jgi:hypothetical protein
VFSLTLAAASSFPMRVITAPRRRTSQLKLRPPIIHTYNLKSVRGRISSPINLVSGMSSDPQSAAIHASDPPASQLALAAASLPLLPASTVALVAPSTGLPADVHGATPVMTNAQLTQGLLSIIQRLEVLHDRQRALQQALFVIQPGLQHPLLPSSSPTTASLPGPAARLRLRPPRRFNRPPAYRST